MICTKILSITYRDKAVEEIIEALTNNNDSGILWSGRISIPTNYIKNTRQNEKNIKDNRHHIKTCGLDIDEKCFKDIITLALILRVPIIRVYAGKVSIPKCSENCNSNILYKVRVPGASTMKKSIWVYFEYKSDFSKNVKETPRAFDALLNNMTA